jgi:hypothetical protein
LSDRLAESVAELQAMGLSAWGRPQAQHQVNDSGEVNGSGHERTGGGWEKGRVLRLDINSLGAGSRINVDSSEDKPALIASRVDADGRKWSLSVSLIAKPDYGFSRTFYYGVGLVIRRSVSVTRGGREITQSMVSREELVEGGKHRLREWQEQRIGSEGDARVSMVRDEILPPNRKTIRLPFVTAGN